MRSLLSLTVVCLVAVGTGCGQTNPAGFMPTSPSVLATSTIDGSTSAGSMSAAASGGAGKGGGKPGGGGGSSTITLAMVNDVNGNGLPNWADQITFYVVTTATTQPHVEVLCTQRRVLVYGATSGYFDGYPWPWTQFMTLSSNAWQGGAANCTATLHYFNGSSRINLTSLTFTADE